ncbi:MAG: hypothetical protein FVQ77_06795 [Cytophagales bacterium]|nr:hypothetical protein [Cytophagales bacterium]
MKKPDKISRLLKLKQVTFHTNDLAIIWGISNKNTLYTTIKRYVKNGVMIRLYKGFYSTLPPGELDPVVLGINSLHAYAYLSTETILAQQGVIAQSVNYITLVSGISARFHVGNNAYISRQLKAEYLYNNTGITTVNEINTASLERATADILYFNPTYYFDAHNVIDWAKVKNIQKEIGY